jgi:hypothetical protein
MTINPSPSCPIGWVHDYVGFAHQENCSLPDTFILIFFITYTVACFISISVTLYVGRGSKRLVSSFKHFFIGWTFITWVVTLCVYLEDGYKASAGVFSILQLVFTVNFGVYLCFGLTSAYFYLNKSFPARRFKQAVITLTCVWCFVFVLPIKSIAASYAYDRQDMNTYNHIIAGWFIGNGIFFLLFCTICYIMFSRLFQSIIDLEKDLEGILSQPGQNATSVVAQNPTSTRGKLSESRMKEALERIQGLKNLMLMCLPQGFALFGIGLALLLTNNQVPYLWISFLIFTSSPVQSITNVLKIVGEGSKKTSSKNNIITSKNSKDGEASSQVNGKMSSVASFSLYKNTKLNTNSEIIVNGE